MRLTSWVTALAVLSLAWAKNSTTKAKPKRQLESIRSPQNLQYSLVLPHSRVSHFRSLNDNRRISYGPTPRGKLPPYAVQMEPVVQYSQKDPLYDPTLENLDDYVNKNEIYIQPKILSGGDQTSHESRYGEPYGSLPTAPLYSHEPQQQYYEAPEPIIEIIIKESNESLPAPPPAPVIKKKKEPVQVFYVKYSKDPHSHDKVVYEKPIPAITPPTNDEDEHEHHEEYVTVTPEPYYVQPQTTTLRAIIKPDSEVYHSDSSVKVTFGKESHHSHYSDRREGNGNNEDHEETAPRPAIAFPQQPPSHPPLERSAQPSQQFHDSVHRPQSSHKGPQNYRPIQQPQQHAQSRIQFQPPYIANEQQLPRQGPSIAPFRGPIARQNPFPTPLSPISNFPGPLAHFPNNAPTLPGPITPAFPTNQPRPNIVPTFHPRPNSQPPFGPRPIFNGPPRPSFHSGPQRPFNQLPQAQPFFDEAKYLQENYHTITTEQVEPPKDQPLPSRPSQNFNFIPKPSPSPTPSQFQEHYRSQQHIPLTQLLPQQRPHQQFVENTHNRPTFAVTPSRSPFYNLKPSPPHIEENRTPFQQPTQQHQQLNQQFSFHQGVQSLSRPTQQIPQQNHQHRFPGPISPSASPIPQTQFLPQPSSTPQFNFQPQPSPIPDHFQHNSPSERPPQFHQFNNPLERPIHHHQSDFQDQSNVQHQQNVGQFVPNGGELVAAIPKYEQHITVNGPTAQPDYSSLSQSSQPSSSPSHIEQQYHQQQDQQRQIQEQQRQQYFDQEQEQVRQQLAQNVKKQQEEIQKLQNQLTQAQNQRQQQQHQQQQQQHQQQQQQQQHQQQQQQHQQQQQQQHEQQQQQQQYQQQQQQHHQHQQLQKQQQESKQYELDYRQLQNNYNQQNVEASSARPQYNQERSRPVSYQSTYPTSTASAPYYQSTSRTIEIRPTTQKYASSTINSINTASEEKEQKKKKPTIELPDEVPDDLRQQLLSSGILDNADISVLDYDKVGETPLESLPPDQLANFFSAGGGQQIAASENRPIAVTPDGRRIQSRIDEEEDDDDQEIAASENIPQYAMPASVKNQAVEMKVVHFDPTTKEGQKVAKEYVKDDATRLEPVALNDKKYNRYLPLKVSGNQFPLPDILKGRKVTSVVVLAPVETEVINQDEHLRRSERATSNSLKGIKFVAGESLQDLLKRPTKENYEKWLKTEKNTAADLQSVVLLVTGSDDAPEEREIFMYDVSSGNVNKLDGELSNAFVEAAENNSLSKDIEKLAIEGEGIPENFDKIEDETVAEGSENVPLLVDLSGLSLDQENSNQVSISSGYSKTKLGRSLQKH